MKTPSPSFLRSFLLAILAASAVGTSSLLHADVTTYTSQGDFFDDLQTGAYFESFTSFSGGEVPSPQAFSFGGFSFTLSDFDSDIFYSTKGTGAPSVYPHTRFPGESFTITFTSGNVTAFGGNFFATGLDFSPVAGDSITETLSTGQTITQTSSATYSAEPFSGFTSNVPILSLTITSAGMPAASPYLTLDNLYIGRSLETGNPSTTAPEPATWTLLLGGMATLIGFRFRTRQQA